MAEQRIYVKRYKRFDPAHVPEFPKPAFIPRPENPTPADNRVLSLRRLDDCNPISQVRPHHFVSQDPALPAPSFGPRSPVTALQSMPLQRPVFQSNIRSLPYPSSRPSAPMHAGFGNAPTFPTSSSVARPCQHRPVVMHSPSSNFTTNAAKASHNRSKALVLWLQLCTIVSHISPHLVELQGYPCETLMLQKMIEPFADTTLLKYLPQVLQFFQAALDQLLCLASLTMPQVIEILWNYHDRLHSDDPEFKTGSSALSCIKALRWCVKLLQLPFPDLYSGPISALTFAEH